MRLYLIQARDDDTRLATRYAGSMREARRTRDELADQFDVKKDAVTIDEVDFATGKFQLLETLNELCSMGDVPEAAS